MIPIPSGVRVWIATGHTDMRRGMQSLALAVQESLKRESSAACSRQPQSGSHRLQILPIIERQSSCSN